MGREGEFDALGIDVAHVFEHQLVEVRARRNGNCRQKVFSLARIVVRREGDPVVKQSQIEAVVPRLGRLPLQLGVVGLGTVGIDGVPAELVLGTVEPRRVDGDVAVVRDAVLLARHAVRYAELQVVDHPAQRREELLLRDAPGKSHGGEGAPAIILREAR